MIKTKWNIEAVKAYETGQGVELVNEPYPHYVPKTLEHKGTRMNKQNEDEVSYSIPIVCIAAILVLTFMMVISK